MKPSPLSVRNIVTAARGDPLIDHYCVVCGEYGTRSNDYGKTWWCFEHDPHREKDVPPIQQQQRAAGDPSWDPCQCCDGKGCPWCQPERYGLPPRKQFSTASVGHNRGVMNDD
jgi:hypothetical protein